MVIVVLLLNAMEREQPDAKIPGGVTVRFKQGEPTTAEMTIRHLVDDWVETDYRFKIDGGVAYLHTVDPEGGKHHLRQNSLALEAAINAMEQLPVIENVEAGLYIE